MQNQYCWLRTVFKFQGIFDIFTPSDGQYYHRLTAHNNKLFRLSTTENLCQGEYDH